MSLSKIDLMREVHSRKMIILVSYGIFDFLSVLMACFRSSNDCCLARTHTRQLEAIGRLMSSPVASRLASAFASSATRSAEPEGCFFLAVGLDKYGSRIDHPSIARLLVRADRKTRSGTIIASGGDDAQASTLGAVRDAWQEKLFGGSPVLLKSSRRPLAFRRGLGLFWWLWRTR